MSLLAELTRPFWLPGIQAVSGRPTKGIAAWIASESFQVYSALAVDEAVLSFATSNEVVSAFAHDTNRMVAAALESAEGIRQSVSLPKSTGWMFIRSYYSAFFAAHAILRMFGRSATQLEAAHIRAIHKIADAYGQRSGITLIKGTYVAHADVPGGTLGLRKRGSSDGGSHAIMWSMFIQLLTDLSSSVLAGGAAPSPSQRVSAKLIELRDVLSGAGFPGGNWLSHIRNRVNYQLAFGAWFPYSERQPYYDALFSSSETWRDDPMTLNLWMQRGRDLQRFVEATALVTSICRSLSDDMAGRHPAGRSFLRLGPQALLNHLARSA